MKEVSELASWAAALRWQDAPASVQDRLELVLLDTLAVTMLGASLPEQRHASCSFTHPAADAVLDIEADGVHEVLVETHSLGGGLSRTTWDSRLGAMFSIPYVVAAALRHGSVRPSSVDDPAVRALARRIRVEVAADLDARLPKERATRVTVRTAGGEVVREVPNPVGDADHEPFDGPGLRAMLAGLLDAKRVQQIADVVHALDTPEDVEASEKLTRRALSNAGPGYDGLLPDCVLDPGVSALSGTLPVFGILRLSMGYAVATGRPCGAALALLGAGERA